MVVLKGFEMNGNDSLGLFLFIKYYIEELILRFAESGIQAMSKGLNFALVTIVTVWVMFEGYRILTGQSKEPITSFLWRVGKMVVITSIAGAILNDPTAVRGWITVNIQYPITYYLTGKQFSDPGAMIDASLFIMQMLLNSFSVAIGESGSDKMGVFMLSSSLGQSGPALVGGAALLLNQIALALCTIPAPAFILCSMFESTKSLFQSWLKFLIGTIMSLVVLTVMVTVGLKAVMVYATAIYMKSLMGYEGIAQASLMQGGLGMLMTVLIVAAPPMVSQFLQGTLGQLNPYNVFGAGGRDAQNNPVGQNGSNVQNSQGNNQGQHDASSDVRPSQGQSNQPVNQDAKIGQDEIKTNGNSALGHAQQKDNDTGGKDIIKNSGKDVDVTNQQNRQLKDDFSSSYSSSIGNDSIHLNKKYG